MTRIIAGRARGRRVKIPSAGTRPTSDRLREALFASVESRLRAAGRGWHDVSVADLWAGSGRSAWRRGWGARIAAGGEKRDGRLGHDGQCLEAEPMVVDAAVQMSALW